MVGKHNMLEACAPFTHLDLNNSFCSVFTLEFIGSSKVIHANYKSWKSASAMSVTADNKYWTLCPKKLVKDTTEVFPPRMKHIK